MISVTINNTKVSVKKGTTIINACKKIGIYIPHLCSHPDLPPVGRCGVCEVKINGELFVKSCVTVCQDGMVIETNTKDVKQNSLNHFQDFVPNAVYEKTPEIEDIWQYYTGKRKTTDKKSLQWEPQSNCSIQWDNTKCVGCNRCINTCQTCQQIDAIDPSTHAFRDNCIKCGHCITVCPVRALTEKDSTADVLKALVSDKVCILQMAPSVRVSVAELFSQSYGTICTGKVIDGARKLGFKYVFDINFGADQTIMEEGTEFMKRLRDGGPLPMYTSCCPGWVNYAETRHPEILDNLSTAKSPHMMSGTAIKKYFPLLSGIKEENIFLVSVMPCTAKKDEILRVQHQGTVDAVITTNEFANLLNQFKIDWESLDDSATFDPLLSQSTGGSTIFGVTGGVAEACVRFCYERMTGTKLTNIAYTQLRGFDGIKTATINIAGMDINVAICNGVGYAHDFLNSGMQSGFHIVEVMACPGGCIGGGGQPYYKPSIKAETVLQGRANSLYLIDKQKQSQGETTTNDNSELAQMYKTFIGEPGGEVAEKYFHTYYSSRYQ